jgi:sec-independent protein translocase protein TatC
MGICFESPLLVFILAKLKIITGKTLLRQWRIALVVIAAVSAAVTPTVDPVNMVLLMLPLTFLYLISVVLAFLAR